MSQNGIPLQTCIDLFVRRRQGTQGTSQELWVPRELSKVLDPRFGGMVKSLQKSMQAQWHLQKHLVKLILLSKSDITLQTCINLFVQRRQGTQGASQELWVPRELPKVLDPCENTGETLKTGKSYVLKTCLVSQSCSLYFLTIS